ncbi:MAG TPA: UDP-glucose/GDP-mannose dehydrogenase family protein [Steroidobacteraceae bacterium]|nr:UDP-glucose/GDP-mannose dehydrogenase family protein [Steroidobacteraceae bacterium]
MRISIVGTGYVGLVTGACLAEHGHDVTCIDVDRSKVDAINQQRAPIHENDLPQLLQRNVPSRLRATTDLAGAVRDSEITFIAVGTPASEGRIDLGFVTAASEEIGAALKAKTTYHTVVVKSTVIPGTTDGVVRDALERASGKTAGRDFGLGMNPEFLTEGQAVADFMNPDRIVVGGIDERARQTIASVYAGFEHAPRILTNTRTAEMIKYASNSVLATLISFSNEIGRLCSAIGDVDVAEVMKGVHAAAYFTTRDNESGATVRAGITSFLEAGCGFGGSCLPKDVTALVAQGRSNGLGMPLLGSVLDINRSQPQELLALVRKHFPDLEGVRVSVLGLAFKPDTDDLRESPAFPIVRALREAQAQITVYDPVARPSGHPDLANVRTATSLEEAVQDAQVLVHVTRWPQFEQIGALLRRLGRDVLVVDGRRNLRATDFERYEGIGRQVRKAP